MDRNIYLDYVRSTYSRVDNEGKVAGITTWGLIIAIVYLLWSSIPLYSSIAKDTPSKESLIILYAFIQILIIALYGLATFDKNTSSQSGFNNRYTINSNPNTSSYLIILFLLLGVPSISLYTFNENKIFIDNNLIHIQSIINISYILFLYLLSTSITIFDSVYEKNTGYPSPTSLILNNKYSFLIRKAIPFIIIIELIVGSLIAIYIICNSLPKDTFEAITTTSLNLSLLIFSIVLLLKSKNNNQRLDKIKDIERDIIFHNLTEDETKSRIQDEIIGHEIGDWLKQKIKNIRNIASDLEEHSLKSTEFCVEYKDISTDLKHERAGRLNEYASKLDSIHELYTKEDEVLSKWLSGVVLGKYTRYEERIMRILVDTFNELKAISDTAKKSYSFANTKLRNLAPL